MIQLLWVPEVFFLRATRSFVGRRPTCLRLSAEETSGKAAIRKNPLFARVTFQRLHEKPDSGNPRLPLGLKPLSQCSVPVSLCRVQVTGSLAVKRPFLSFIFTSLLRLLLSTLSVLHFHSLVKPLLQELQRHETSGVRKETDGRGQKTRQTSFHVKFAFVHSLLYCNISQGTQNTRTSSIDITFQLWNIPRRYRNRNPSKSSTGMWKLARNQRQPLKR